MGEKLFSREGAGDDGKKTLKRKGRKGIRKGRKEFTPLRPLRLNLNSQPINYFSIFFKIRPAWLRAIKGMRSSVLRSRKRATSCRGSERPPLESRNSSLSINLGASSGWLSRA